MSINGIPAIAQVMLERMLGTELPRAAQAASTPAQTDVPAAEAPRPSSPSPPGGPIVAGSPPVTVTLFDVPRLDVPSSIPQSTPLPLGARSDLGSPGVAQSALRLAVATTTEAAEPPLALPSATLALLGQPRSSPAPAPLSALPWAELARSLFQGAPPPTGPARSRRREPPDRQGRSRSGGAWSQAAERNTRAIEQPGEGAGEDDWRTASKDAVGLFSGARPRRELRGLCWPSDADLPEGYLAEVAGLIAQQLRLCSGLLTQALPSGEIRAVAEREMTSLADQLMEIRSMDPPASAVEVGSVIEPGAPVARGFGLMCHVLISRMMAALAYEWMGGSYGPSQRTASESRRNWLVAAETGLQAMRGLSRGGHAFAEARALGDKPYFVGLLPTAPLDQQERRIVWGLRKRTDLELQEDFLAELEAALARPR